MHNIKQRDEKALGLSLLAKEVATNGAPNDHKERSNKFSKRFSLDNNKGRKKNWERFSPYKGSNHGLLENLVKSPREILAIDKAANAFEQPPCMKGKAKASDTQLGSENSSDSVIIRVRISGRQANQVYMDSGSYYEVIYKHCFLKLKPSIRSLRVDSEIPLVGFSRKQSWSLGEVHLEVTIGESPYTRTEILNFVIIRSNSSYNLLFRRNVMQKIGIVVSTIHAAVKFHTPFLDGLTVVIGKQLPTSFKRKLQELLRANTDMFAWTYADMTGIPKTIMVGGQPFNIEHKLNEYKHIEPIKQKNQGLAPE
ncbi:hypothetical protein Tco_1410605 [Tanacetum coccineum]